MNARGREKHARSVTTCRDSLLSGHGRTALSEEVKNTTIRQRQSIDASGFGICANEIATRRYPTVTTYERPGAAKTGFVKHR